MHPLDNLVVRNLRLENLQNAMAELNSEGQKLIQLCYKEQLSIEAIGKIFGVSKMAISERLKKCSQEVERVCLATGSLALSKKFRTCGLQIRSECPI